VRLFSLLVLVLVLLPCQAAAQNAAAQNAAPQRRLVYGFTWGTNNDTQMQNSGMSEQGGTAGSGMQDFNGSASDKGTITVDVTREQPDSGLVVSISEQAQTRRSSPPATCVVYGDTTVICDPNKHINAEEYTLLRFLGAHFVDPNQIDAKRHWHLEREGRVSTVADYTISKNDAGKLSINEVRVIQEQGARPRTTTIDSTIGYDFNHQIPTAISEQSTERSEQDNQYVTVTAQTILTLQSDSMAPTKN
jgi:co-chaperonin GroES (HSP10)